MDIDHLYLMSYNYKKGEDGKLTNKFDSQTEAKKYHQNMIMDCMMTLLKDTENSTHSLYKSIDNDTDLAKDVADKIPVFGSNKHKAFNFGALTEQVERKNDYITGKKGIGPFALNVTNQILTYLYNIQFKDTKFCEETGIWKLDHLEDWDDNSIQAWLGAFINGHVDIVKDPWVSKLNVNPFTYNMLNLLLRSGFGEVALWFLSQPIIRDMAAASDNAQSQFLRDPYKDGSVWKAREKAILEAVKKYVPESRLTPEYINEFLNQKDPTRRINAVNFLKENVHILEKIVTGEQANFGKESLYDYAQAQEMVFFAWKALEKYAAALGAFVQHTKIDTRKHGKSLIEIANYRDGYNKIFHPEGADRQSSLWDLDSLDHFARHSWLEQKTNAAISWPFKILHGQTFNGNESFMKMCISICRTLVGKNGTISTDLLQLISRHMQTKIKSKYFLDYARNYLQMSDEDITGLFVGDFTIAKRLNNLKYAIQHFEQYNRLANNRLLNQIMPVNQSEPITVTDEKKKQDTIERPQFITVLDNVDSSRINSDDLIDGWVDLLNDSDKNVKKFARDLIIYAFLTSGEFKGWNKLFKYVPPQWLRGQIDTDFKSYSKFVKEELLSTFASSEDDIDEIVSNNDTDFKIVKTMKDEDEDGNKNFVAKTHLVLIGRQRTKKEDIDELPVYISVDNPMESNRNRNGKNLFKFVDMYHGYPIYMRMRHKGYHYGNTDIYEYGWTFEYLENGLRQSRLTDYQNMYEKAQRYIDSLDNHAVDEFEQNPEEVAGAIIKAALYSEDNTVEADQVLTPQEIVEQEMPNEEGEYDWEYLEDSGISGLFKGVNNPANYSMQSGGARGADSIWGDIASEFGITNQNHWYSGERSEHNAPRGNKQISDEDYEEGRHKVAQAARMNWGYQYDTMKDDRLIRNWAQVKYADVIFAIGHIVGKGERVFPNQQNDTRVASTTVVQGGTGYAVGMAILEGKPVYVFDQERGKWAANISGTWQWLDETPTLTRNFAGIGTRNINSAGIQAIRDVFEKTFGNKQQNLFENNPLLKESQRSEEQTRELSHEQC